jgi:hypothetical protein
MMASLAARRRFSSDFIGRNILSLRPRLVVRIVQDHGQNLSNARKQITTIRRLYGGQPAEGLDQFK